MIFWRFTNQIEWLLFGLTLGLLFGLVSGLIAVLFSSFGKIEPVEVLQLTLSRELRRKIWTNSIIGLIAGLLAGLIFAGLGDQPDRVPSILVTGLTLGSTGGLISGLVGGLKKELVLRHKPNQGIWSSFQNMLVTTVLSYPLWVIAIAPMFYLPETQSISIDVCLGKSLIPATWITLFFAFLVGGGVAFTQHFVCVLSSIAVSLHRGGMCLSSTTAMNVACSRALVDAIGFFTRSYWIIP